MIKRHHALLSAMMMFAACSGDCSCDGFEQRPYPPEKYNQMIPNSGVVRITPTGFDFVEQNLPAILDNLIPGGLDFCIPADSSGSPQICYLQSDVCTGGAPGCQLSVTIDDASITPMPNDTLMVDVTLGGLDETISAQIDFLGSQDCLIRFHSSGNNQLPATVDAQIPITFTIDPQSPTNDVKISTGEIQLDLSNLDFQSSGDLLCLAGNLGFVQGFITDQITDQFQPILDGLFDQFLCTSCEDSPCQTGTCNSDDICEFGNGECVPILIGVEGGLQLGSVIGDFSENPEAEVDLSLRAADTAVVDTGVSMGLRSGYEPTEFSNCIPVDPTSRDYAATPLSPTVSGNTKPNGDPFMFGLGYHKKAVEQMLWATWGSGATCFRIGAAQIDLLTTNLFGALLPSIKTLALNKNSELYIKIVPQKEPVVELGANTLDANGNIDDPLMAIDWKDFDLHIYGYTQSRFTRVATIRMDLLIPIGMSANAGEITILIGDLAQGIQNQRVLQTELIAEDPQRLLDIIPTLISMALPALADALADPVALPEFFGFRINIGPGDITSVDNETYIALFGNLELAGTPLRAAHDTRIIRHAVSYNSRMPSGIIKPIITMDVATTSQLSSPLNGPVDTTEVLFSYRVDEGVWSAPQSGRQLVIDHPLLVIPGNHKIEVRSQQKGVQFSLEEEPAVQRVRIDYTAPDLALEPRQAQVDLLLQDDVTKSELIQTRYKLGNDDWTGWTSTTVLNVSVDAPTLLVVEARDENGNVSQEKTTLRKVQQALRTDGPTTASPETAEPKSGCATTNSKANLPLLLLFALVAFARRRRRKKITTQTAALALLALTLMFSSCDCGDDAPSEDCQCSESQICVDNQCVDNTCMTDDDCGEQVCVNFVCVDKETCEASCSCPDGEFGECNDAEECVCEPYCADGCGDGEYCCFQDNSCQDVPDPCAETTCENGFIPELSGTPAGDSETCGVTGATCECVPVPPLDIGIHGQFTSFDQFESTTVVATYNTTYEDLMVGTIAQGGATTWYWVDGVPADGMVTGAVDGPRNGIVTKGEDVGTHTAVVIDDSQTIHVVYRDEDRDLMKYARGTFANGSYTFETADFVSDVESGYWPSMIRTGTQIDLVFSTKTTEATPGNFQTILQHATFSTTAPVDALAPAFTTIDTATAANPCGFDCAAGMKCFATSGVCGMETNDCANDCGEDLCYQAACEPEYTSPPQGYDLVVGSYTELSRTSDGFLLVYFDRFADSIKWTRFDGNNWSNPLIVGATTGPFGSGVVDTNGDVALAYQDRSENRLVFELNNSVEEIRTGVRDTANWWIVNDIGEDVQLRQNDGGEFVVIFQDATEHILYRGLRPSAGTWNVSGLVVPGNPYMGASGFYISLLKSGANDTFIHTQINNQAEPPSAGPVLFQ